MHTLRTTLALTACATVTTLACLGPALEPHAESLLANLLKLTTNTKKLVASAAAASAEAARLARIRHENGLTDFLAVLDADRARLAAEDALIQAHTEAATSLIAVFKALGGGWDGPPP